MCSLVTHFLNELQANLSLSNTPHSMQKKVFSLPKLIIGVSRKMFLEFCNNLHPACETSAWIWHKGNYCIGYRSVVKVVIDVNLQEIHAINLRYEYVTDLRTFLAALIVPLTTKSRAPGKIFVPLILS
jgi:hypothetical protein